jgi:hypothetical protein
MHRLLPLVKLVLMALLAVFAPVKASALTALILCIVDLFTGLIAARKKRKAITSNGLGKTIVKIVVYESAILLTFLVDQYLAGLFPLSNVVSGLIGITELKSCLENLNIIAGGQVLKAVIRAIRVQASNNTPDEPSEGSSNAP